MNSNDQPPAKTKGRTRGRSLSSDEAQHQKWWEKYGFDSPAEWNFSRVPESELIACCYWEYARESATIKLVADVSWCITRHIWHREDYKRDPALLKKHEESANIIKDRAKSAKFNHDAFMAKFWRTDYPLLGIYDALTNYVREDALAWQHLPRHLRNVLVQKVTETSMLHPMCMSSVGELEELWKANSSYLLEVRSRVRDENDDCEDCALYTETVPVQSLSLEEKPTQQKVSAALTIDFSRYTDLEITEAFVSWLKKQRPKQWRRPRRVLPGARQRGRKLVEYRVALERLGLMRLLHWHSPAEIRDELPEAWKTYQRKENDFRREVREAAKFFRMLFPFLPRRERPESEERHGVWLPAMLKIAEEVERKMGLGGGSK